MKLTMSLKGSDILTCSETWLSSSVPNHLVSIPAMDLYRYDRDMGVRNGIESLRGGGVACYIRKELNLNGSVCPEYTRACCNIEIMTLKCIHDFGKIMHILTIYRPPRGSCEEFFKILSSFVELGNLLNYDLYICGDFNIDYLHRNDIKTKMFINFLRTFGLRQHITSATRVTAFSKTCVDFIISNTTDSKFLHVGVLNDVISDHHPVFICIKKQRNKVEFSKIKGRTYKYDFR